VYRSVWNLLPIKLTNAPTRGKYFYKLKQYLIGLETMNCIDGLGKPLKEP